MIRERKDQPCRDANTPKGVRSQNGRTIRGCGWDVIWNKKSQPLTAYWRDDTVRELAQHAECMDIVAVRDGKKEAGS
jgi:hypothetical protein